MKFLQSNLAALLLAASGVSAVAAPFQLQQPIALSAELTTTSRYYDHFSEAFAEVGLEPDGFYQVSNPANMFGSGFDAFPNETAFDVGGLSVDASGLTGSGTETAPVTGLSLDVDDSVSSNWGPYTTQLSGLTGTLTLVDGVPSSLTLSANLTFTFTTGFFNTLSFNGTLSINNNQLSLDADGSHNVGQATPFREQWDLVGTLNLGPGTSPGSLQVNFTGGLTQGTFDGPASISPYQAGNALASFISANPGAIGTDILRVDGQFYLSGWDGSDGTFTSGATPGAAFFLHSPLLERLEANTWRAEGPSNHGTQTGSGDPIAERSKFLLPKTNTFGTATLRISNGVPVELTYTLNFTPEVPSFNNRPLPGVVLEQITLNSTGVDFGTAQTFTIGTDDNNVPYGFNTLLASGVYPPALLSATVMNTTRAMLRNEIDNNTDEAAGNTGNISTDGRLNGGTFPSSGIPSTSVYLADPFANETGTLTVFTVTGLTVGINATVPLQITLTPPINNQLTLAWDGRATDVFQLQKSSTLQPGSWVNVGAGVTGPSSAPITIGTTDEFYRVTRVTNP